ncbi:MAG: hypothetical protein KKD44_26705 [Proteobacteria bacterium]|nr:hypothetical protein [Pseudomonadota bacterium]
MEEETPKVEVQIAQKPSIGNYFLKKTKETKDPNEIRVNKHKLRRQNRLDEIDDEIEILEAEKKLATVKGEKPKNAVPMQQKNLLSGIFAGKSAKEIAEISSELTPESIENLKLLASEPQDPQTAMMLKFIKNPETNVKDTVALIQAVTKPNVNQQTDLKGIAALMKEMRESATPAPRGSSDDTYDKYIKPMFDELKATREQAAKDNMARVEKEIAELKNRPSWAEELAQKKQEFLAFKDTLGGGGSEGTNMELARMKIENERWKMEETWKRQDRLDELGFKKHSEDERNKLVKDIVGKALKSEVVKDAVQGIKNKVGSIVNPGPSAKAMENKFACPDCLANGKTVLIDATGEPASVACPECKKEFKHG